MIQDALMSAIDNRERENIMDNDLNNFVSPAYDLSMLNLYGEDVFISKNVEIRRPQLVKVGSHVAIDSGFYLTTGAEIANYVHIGPYVCVIGGANGMLRLGNFTNIAAGGRLICVSDQFTGEGLITAPGIPSKFTNLIIAPIIFEDFVNVGASAVILPGVILREGTVVGAGSVVTHSTDPWTIYVGNPARPLKGRPKERILEYAKQLGYPFT